MRACVQSVVEVNSLLWPGVLFGCLLSVSMLCKSLQWNSLHFSLSKCTLAAFLSITAFEGGETVNQSVIKQIQEGNGLSLLSSPSLFLSFFLSFLSSNFAPSVKPVKWNVHCFTEHSSLCHNKHPGKSGHLSKYRRMF